MTHWLSILIGVIAGIFSGFFGVGGGIIMIPAMVILLGMTQHTAQGTTLAAILPPVFIFGVWKYYQAGNVNMPIAVFVALGLTLGAFLGAAIVQGVPDLVLKRCFGALLVFVGVRLIFWG
ncbi:MAG: sulfite exporter TauE/SafE family protein [Candidatus Omnitrophica bacterium]|nr:sulfite exporter TauE/SafE family protein [Candidatus Omnitrophota bacterium]